MKLAPLENCFLYHIRIGRHWQLHLLDMERCSTEMTAWNESNLKYFYFIALFTHLSISCNTSTLYHISYIAELPIFSTRFYSILLSLYFVQVCNFILLGGHNGTFDFSITPIINDFIASFPIFKCHDPFFFLIYFYVLHPKDETKQQPAWTSTMQFWVHLQIVLNAKRHIEFDFI